MTATISSTEYRELVKATDGPAEVSSEQYRRMMGNPASVADYIGQPHSSTVDTESEGKRSFREWLTYATNREMIEEFAGAIPQRRFRFDWAIPTLKIAFEYDGFGDHATLKGILRDAEKSNLAQLNGWLFIRVNAKSVRDGSAFEHAEHAILKRLKEWE